MPFRFPSPVYPIADAVDGRDTLALAEALLAGGARLLQLRAKTLATGAFVELARAVKAAADRTGALLIINDRADIALLIGAGGVHLGQDDLPSADARALLGPGKVIGTSTHNLAQVDAALAAGAIDYLAFGPIFATRSKHDPDPAQGLDALRAVRAGCPLPLVAIGGIDASTAPAVRAAGADAIAVISALSGAADPAAALLTLLAAARTESA